MDASNPRLYSEPEREAGSTDHMNDLMALSELQDSGRRVHVRAPARLPSSHFVHRVIEPPHSPLVSCPTPGAVLVGTAGCA